MPLFGPPDVMGLASRGDAQGLIHALKYDRVGAGSMHHGVRVAAAAALGRIGSDGPVEALIVALKYPDSSDVHSAVAEALAKIGDARAVDPLVGALVGADSNSFVLEAAALALGEMGERGELGDADAVESLIAALGDEIREVCRAAAEALGRVGDSAAIESLIAALEDPDAGAGEAATEALGKMGAEVVEPLVVAVNAPSGLVRAAAAKALVRILASVSQPAIEALSGRVESLVACLDSRDAALRKSAARLLGKIGDARAIEALDAALSHDSPDVVQAAADAMDGLRWRPDRTASGMAYCVSQGESDRCLEVGAVGILSLLAAPGGRHQATKLAAGEALVQMGAQTVGPVIEALTGGIKPVRSGAARVLGRIGDARAVGPLIASLSDRSEGCELPPAQRLWQSARRLCSHRSRSCVTRASGRSTCASLGSCPGVHRGTGRGAPDRRAWGQGPARALDCRRESRKDRRQARRVSARCGPRGARRA